MKTIELVSIFAAIELLLFVILGAALGKNILEVILNPGNLALIVFINLLCLFGSYVVFELKLRPIHKKKRIFQIGLLAGLIIYVVAIITLVYELRFKEKVDQTAFQNRAILQNFVNDDELYIRKAFNALEKNFKDSNAFKLQSLTVRSKDTVSSMGTDFVYSVYFTYYIKGKKKKLFLTKVSVFRLEPKIQVFNMEAAKSEEYAKIRKSKAENDQEIINNLNQVIRNLEDSPSKVIKVEK